MEMSHASETSLEWGRSPGSQTAVPAAKPAIAQHMIHDAQVVATAWEETDASLPAGDEPEVMYVADGRSVVIKRSSTLDVDRSDTSEAPISKSRFAQLPPDPFDEPAQQDSPAYDPFDEPISEPNLDIEDAQVALESEIDRRESEENYELFDEPSDDSTSDSSNDAWLNTDLPVDLDSNDSAPIDEGEQADTELFDEMTSEELVIPGEGSEESLQYGRDLDLSLPQPANGELTDEQRQAFEEERKASEESCREEVEKLRAQTLETIDVTIRVQGNMGEDFPFECALEEQQHQPRQWPQVTYMWKAAGLCHKPLYFEQVALERYGHSWGPYTQPIMSGVHFFGTLPILPYKMGLRTPNECVYTLGYYRPGNCAPYLVGGVPFTWRAAAFQAGAATGMSYIFP
jgi:hypothetical protein